MKHWTFDLYILTSEMFYIKNVNKIGKVAEDSDREGDQADGCVLDTGVSAEYAEMV